MNSFPMSSESSKSSLVISKQKKKNLLLSEYVTKSRASRTLFPSDGFYVTPMDVIVPVVAVYLALNKPNDEKYISDIAGEYILGNITRRYSDDLLRMINEQMQDERTNEMVISLIENAESLEGYAVIKERYVIPSAKIESLIETVVESIIAKEGNTTNE